jgi:hypothetical protein
MSGEFDCSEFGVYSAVERQKAGIVRKISEPRWLRGSSDQVFVNCGYGTAAVDTLTCGPTMAIARPGAAFTFATSENVC